MIYILTIIILLILCIILTIVLILYKKQIVDLKEQIEFITNNNTNLNLRTSTIPISSVRKLTSSLNNLMSSHRQLELKLNNSNQSYKEMITNISHDLRTPLTSANGYIQMLNNKKLSEEKQEEYIKIIENRLNAVKELLNELFEYSMIESNSYQFNMKKINVNNILRDTISIFYNDFIEKGIEPTINITNETCYINGDFNALKRIFQNIINNAIIHGNGEIKIDLIRDKEDIIISFKNKVDQIEDEDLNRIFERFYIADKSRNKKSTGLGLAITKNFVESMNGTINASINNNEFTINVKIKKY